MGRNINENTELQAATPAIEINRLLNLIGSGEQVLRGVAGVTIIVSGLSIFISLFSSLRERRYELALMRVMGGQPLPLVPADHPGGTPDCHFGLWSWTPPQSCRHVLDRPFDGGCLPLLLFGY